MIGWLIRRIGQALLVVLVMTVIVFVGLHAIGNPVDILIGQDVDQIDRARIITELGLDKPLWQQYLAFLNGALHGNLGKSFVYNEPAIQLILQRLPATLELAFAALIIAVVIGVPLGLFAGLYPSHPLSRLLMTGSVVGFSLPTFWVGLMLIMAAILGFGGCPTMTQRGGIPRLGLDEMIIPAPGAKPLRIARAGPEGIWCENELGEPRLVSNEDISSGKAVHVPGIRQAIDVQYLEPSQAPKGHLYVIDQKNRGLAERDKKKAIEQYLVCDMPGKEHCLFDSVRLFQRALAYYGMTFLPDSNENKIRLTALDRLIDKVHNLYTQAIVFEKAGEYQQAWATYKTILKYVPEAKNPVFRNVSRRMAALKPHMPKKR